MKYASSVHAKKSTKVDLILDSLDPDQAMSQTCLPCKKAENNSTNGADDILFFRENMAWYFMWIADNSHEKLKPYFFEKNWKEEKNGITSASNVFDASSVKFQNVHLLARMGRFLNPCHSVTM